MTAADRVAAARALIPTLGDHAVIPGSAAPSPELDVAWALLEAAVTSEPASAEVHALRGNLLVRRGDTAAARRSYALAARIDPYDAPSRIALGELAFMAGAAAESDRWFGEAFALTHLYAPAARSGTRSALVLCVAGPWHRNIPLDFVIDPARWTLHRWYLPDPDAARTRLRLPAYDVAINAIGESDAGRDALAAAAAFIAEQPAPAVNDPQHVARTGRAALADAVRSVPDCAAATSRRVARDELAALAGAGPLLVRPADAHGGRGLERLDDAAARADYLTRSTGDAFDVTPFVEYRSADGFYRKYRVMFVGGAPYAYHLAIDRTWMIHYYRAPMAEHAWMRDEERRFIERPDAVIPGWSTTLPAIAAALGLDYAGIDCTVLADGTLFVFEADAAMLVHDFDPDPAKRGAYGRIGAALDALLAGRAGASATFRP